MMNPKATSTWVLVGQIASLFSILLPGNLAVQHENGHMAGIELRPNDLASPRIPRLKNLSIVCFSQLFIVSVPIS
jgi:hypothetical protein